MIIQTNYWVVFLGSILAMVIGAVWYGPLFGKKWMQVVGVTAEDLKKRKEMQKQAGPLYLIQFLLTIFQVFLLSRLAINYPGTDSLILSLIFWAAFVIPTLAGTAMWNNDTNKIKWARFLIQGGYQLCIFMVFGLLLRYWA